MLGVLLFGLTLFFGKYWSVICFRVSIPVSAVSQDLFQLQKKVNPEPIYFSREHNATLHLLWGTFTQNAVHSKNLPGCWKPPVAKPWCWGAQAGASCGTRTCPGPGADKWPWAHCALPFDSRAVGKPSAKNGLFGNTKMDYSAIPVPQQVNSEWCTLVLQ